MRWQSVAAAGLVVLLGGSALALAPQTAQTDEPAPPAQEDRHVTDSDTLKKATFGAGCFWGVEAAFRQVKGVKETAVGYSGGNVKNPTYQQVCTDRTGHAEVVQVVYNPAEVSYERLLQVFWESHDPTQVNRQGPDIGYQYRSVIFVHDEAQRKAAEASKDSLQRSGQFRRPIATSIEPAQTFWVAEEYHQQYLEKRGLASCGL